MFINRIKELQKLEEEYNKKNATFSVIYGRRRVGKPALISKFIQNKSHVYIYITQDRLQLQLNSLVSQIKNFVDDSIKEFLNFDSFESVLEFIATLKLNEKLIIEHSEKMSF